MKVVVLDAFAVNPGDLSWDFLSKYGETKIYDATSPEEIVPRSLDAEIIFVNRVKMTHEVISQLPKLRFISALGTGYDMIDVEACRKRGIVVCNAPGYSSVSVAQHAFMLLLALATDINGLCNIVRDGMWTGVPGFHYEKVKNTELLGKTVGIIGYGGIGARMATLCAAFGMRVIATSKTRTQGGDSIATFVTMDTLLCEGDFVSLHCPLNDETREMVNESFIARMKPGACLINTSRGAVVDEPALAAALNAGRLGGAGLDVLACEPALPSNPLLYAKNCIITPHCAWTSIEARRRLLDILDKNLASFVEYGRVINEVK